MPRCEWTEGCAPNHILLLFTLCSYCSCPNIVSCNMHTMRTFYPVPLGNKSIAAHSANNSSTKKTFFDCLCSLGSAGLHNEKCDQIYWWRCMQGADQHIRSSFVSCPRTSWHADQRNQPLAPPLSHDTPVLNPFQAYQNNMIALAVGRRLNLSPIRKDLWICLFSYFQSLFMYILTVSVYV